MTKDPQPLLAIHVVSSLDPRSGGVSTAVCGLCRALAGTASRVGVVTSGDCGREELAGRLGRATVWCGSGGRFGAGTIARTLARLTRSPGGASVRDTLVHCHGLWELPAVCGAHLAAGRRIPLVWSPHGMLYRQALARSRFRKRLAWAVYQRRLLGRAACLHATSRQEAESFRRLGLANPVAVIPFGVEGDGSADDPAEPDLNTWPGDDGRRVVLFFSRLHPVKNLIPLIHAWAGIQRERPDWRLVVAGPDCNGHRAAVERAVSSRGVGDSVRLIGPVYGPRRWALYRRAEVLVLPSAHENFGFAVAESLSVGTPVIATRGAPWEDLRVHRCGWWIELGVEPLARALAEATGASPGRLRSMGARGRELVRRKYSWQGVAEKLVEVYEWLLGGGTRPSSVIQP